MDAIGHRVLHGGAKITQSCIITDEVLKVVEECCDLGPLHNPANLKGIYACQKLMRSFFQNLLELLQKESMKMEAKEWKKTLLTEKKNGYDRMPAQEREAMDRYCEGYKAFLDAGKTERECVREGIRLAEEKGFRPYHRGMELKTGDRVYLDNRGKMLLLAVIGQKSLAEGAQITAAHIDSPRLDLKPNPLYEAEELAYLKTHYYGGIR